MSQFVVKKRERMRNYSLQLRDTLVKELTLFIKEVRRMG